MPHPQSERWSGEQRRIGLTGGIATGKSSVGHWLEQRGIPVLDADHYARDALAPGTPASQAVVERFGPAICLRETNHSNPGQPSIDRAVLGRIVFQNRSERRWLENLIHPLVRQRFQVELDALSSAPCVVLMIPLLFEAGLEPLCSEVWLVDCDEDQQQERLMARNQLNQADAKARIEAQLPLERKRALADVLISNRGTPGAWRRQVEQLLNASH